MRIHSAGCIVSSDDAVVAISFTPEERGLLRDMASDVTVFMAGPPGTGQEVLSRVGEAAKRGVVFDSGEAPERCAKVRGFFAWMRTEVARLNGLADQTKKELSGELALAGALVAFSFLDQAKMLQSALDEAESRGILQPE